MERITKKWMMGAMALAASATNTGALRPGAPMRFFTMQNRQAGEASVAVHALRPPPNTPQARTLLTPGPESLRLLQRLQLRPNTLIAIALLYMAINCNPATLQALSKSQIAHALEQAAPALCRLTLPPGTAKLAQDLSSGAAPNSEVRTVADYQVTRVLNAHDAEIDWNLHRALLVRVTGYSTPDPNWIRTRLETAYHYDSQHPHVRIPRLSLFAIVTEADLDPGALSTEEAALVRKLRAVADEATAAWFAARESHIAKGTNIMRQYGPQVSIWRSEAGLGGGLPLNLIPHQ